MGITGKKKTQAGDFKDQPLHGECKSGVVCFRVCVRVYMFLCVRAVLVSWACACWRMPSAKMFSYAPFYNLIVIFNRNAMCSDYLDYLS